MGEWKEYKLGEVYDFTSGLSKKRDQFGFGYGFLSFKDVFHNCFIPKEITQLVNSTEKERERCSIRRGDVFLTRTSETQEDLGMSSVALKDYPDATFNGFTKRLRPKNNNMEILPEYAGFYFRSPRFRAAVTSMASITTRASLNNGMLSELTVATPSLPEQKAIASVLSSLDDKTDLLRRQNKTLEAMAETLFRQWFAEEAREDWKEKPLDEVAEYLNGLACQKYPPKNDADKLPVLKIKELRNGITDNSDWATTDVRKDYIVQNGDIIFSWSGSLLVRIWDGGKCILNQHLFKVTSGTYPKWFVYLWTKYHLEKFIAIAESKATTMGHIKRRDLSHSMVLVPTEQELDNMNDIVCPLIGKIILNNKQIIRLERLRDTLLPKLMSGEVRVQYDKAQNNE